MKWSDVERDPAFLSFSPEQRAKYREGYFKQHVAPNVAPEERDAVWREFEADTRPSMSKMWKPSPEKMPQAAMVPGHADGRTLVSPREAVPAPDRAEYVANRFKGAIPDMIGNTIDAARHLPGAIAGLVNSDLIVNQVAAEAGLTPEQRRMKIDELRRQKGLDRPFSERFPMRTAQLLRDWFGVESYQAHPESATRWMGDVAELAGTGPFPQGKGNIVRQVIQGTPSWLAQSAAGGTGMTLGREAALATGGDEGLGQFLGALAGGAVPAVSHSALRSGTGRLRPEAGAAERRVGERMSSIVDAEGAWPEIQRSIALEREVNAALPPGSKLRLTLSERTGSPNVLAEESALMRRSEPANRIATERRIGNRMAVKALQENDFGGLPAGEPARLVANMRDRHTVETQQIDKDIANLEAQRDKLAERLRDTPQNEAIGQQFRATVERLRGKSQTGVEKRYKDFYQAADKAGFTDDVSDVVKLARDSLGPDEAAYFARSLAAESAGGVAKLGAAPKTRTREPPKNYKGSRAAWDRSQQMRTEKEADAQLAEVPVSRVHAMLKAVNQEIGQNLGLTTQDNMRRRTLTQMKGMLEDKLKRFDDPELGEVAATYSAATQAAAQHGERFKTGIGGAIGSRKNYDDWTIDDEDVIGKLVEGRNVTNLRRFMKTVGDDSDAMREAQQGLLAGYMRSLSQKIDPMTGRLEKKKAAAWLQQHDEALRATPQIHDFMRRTVSRAEGLAEDYALLSKARADRDKTAVGKALEKTNSDETRFFQALEATDEGGVPDPTMLKQMLSGFGPDTRVQGGIARMVAERVMAQKNPVAYFEAHKPQIEQVLAFASRHGSEAGSGVRRRGTDHMRNLERLIEVERMVSRGETQAKGAAYKLEDPVTEKLGTSPQSIESRGRSVTEGRSSTQSATIGALTRLWIKIRGEQREKAMMRAIYDEDFAAFLAGANKMPQKTFMGRLQRALLEVGARATVGLDKEAPATTEEE